MKKLSKQDRLKDLKAKMDVVRDLVYKLKDGDKITFISKTESDKYGEITIRYLK